MGQHRWYLTSILLGFLLLSLGVLAARWSVLAQRVPLQAAESSAALGSAKQEGPADKAGAYGNTTPAGQVAGLLDLPQTEKSAGDSARLQAEPDNEKAPQDIEAKPAAGGKVDINSAGVEELDSLPGIGPKLAEAIIAHRKASGRFTSIEGLLDVPGIGEAKLADLRGMVEAR